MSYKLSGYRVLHAIMISYTIIVLSLKFNGNLSVMHYKSISNRLVFCASRFRETYWVDGLQPFNLDFLTQQPSFLLYGDIKAFTPIGTSHITMF